MIEILHPVADADRVREIRAAGVTEVDLWATATDELRVLDALDPVEPGEQPAERFDLGDAATTEEHTRYVLLPWRSTLVRMPDEAVYYRIRTARNRHLLTAVEQELWRRARIGIAGLGVGSAALAACALTGARYFHLADPDELAPTNLNRIQGSVCDVGRPKVDLAQQRLWEADPYTVVRAYPAGYRATDADAFLRTEAGHALTLVIEEIDDVALKIDLRLRARTARIPVVSATDMGDNVVLDVERFDLDERYPIFHGRVEGFAAGDAADVRQRVRMAAAIVGDTLTPRMAFSANQLGRSVASWPQLGSTAAMAGAVAAVAARYIVCGRPMVSGRYVLDVEGSLLGAAATRAEGWNEWSADQIAEFLATLRRIA